MIATSTTANQRAVLLDSWKASNRTIQKMADDHGVTFLEMAYLLNAAIGEQTSDHA